MILHCIVHTLSKSSTAGLSSSFGRICPPFSLPSFFPRAGSLDGATFGVGFGAGLGAGAGAGAGADSGAGVGAGAGAAAVFYK